MVQLEVLVLKFIAIDAFAASSISSGEISTLTHESWDYSVEFAVLESKTFFTSAESSEVF